MENRRKAFTETRREGPSTRAPLLSPGASESKLPCLVDPKTALSVSCSYYLLFLFLFLFLFFAPSPAALPSVKEPLSRPAALDVLRSTRTPSS